MVNIKQESTRLAEQLKRDIEALEFKLENSQDLKERAAIQAEIKALEGEKAGLTDLSNAPEPLGNPLLLHGLGNRLEEINQEIDAEKMIEERRRLMEKKMRCLNALEARRKAIVNPKELEAAFVGIDNDNFFIESLQGSDFDYQHLGDLLQKADIASFFDPKLIAELEMAEQRLVTTNLVEEALRPARPENLQASAESWIAFKEKNEVLIAAIEAGNLSVIQKHLPQFSALKKLEKGSREDRWLQDYKQHLIDQREKQGEYLHKQLLNREVAGKKQLIRHLPEELAKKTQQLIVEAREIRMEQVRHYLRGRYQKLKEKYETKKSLFSAGQRGEMDKVFVTGEGLFEDLTTLEKLKELNESLNLAEGALDESLGDLEKTENNRSGVAETVRTQFKQLKKQIQAFTPTRIAELMEARRKEEVKRLTRAGKPPRPEKSGIEALKAQSPIFKKDIEMLEKLGGSEFAGYVRDFEKNRLPELETLKPTELQAVANELQSIHSSLGQFGENFGEKMDEALNPTRLADAKKARRAIAQIAHAKSVEEVKSILAELGPNRVQYVSHQKFETEYRRYTTTGHMVFYERGEDWAIILDASALRNKENLRKLQKQITHELLHLEFERNDELKSLWSETYTTNPQWPAIKQAFVDAFPAKAPPDYKGVTKTQYTVGDWSNEAVMSELYAMQNELGRERVFDKSPVGKLNNLIFTAGIGAAALAKEGGKPVPQELFRGSEEGVDEAAMHGAMGHADEEHAEGGGEHGKISETAKGAYEQNQNDIEMRDKELKELIGSEYVGYIPAVGDILHLMKKYLERTKTLNHKLRETGSGFLVAEIANRLKTLKDEMVKIAAVMANIGAKIPNEKMGPFRKLWQNLTFLSISDIFHTGHQVVEYIERRHKRKEEEAAAKLGMALFGKTTLGREAMAQKLKAEEAEVHEWQERYHHLGAFELFELIDEIADAALTPNKDQLKAILRILAEKGRLDWRQPGLWKALNKLQGAVHLTPGDPVLSRNVPLLRQKLHTAIGNIWEFDEYLKLDKQNDDAYESGKKKFEPVADSIQASLTERMGQLLQQHIDEKHHHGYSQVDPQEFEEMIEYAITKGKSSAEATMFYLMAGTIHGLLRPDRGMVLDKNLNTWPATQWIYSKEPPLGQEDYKAYAEKYFGDELKNNKPGWQFKNFYWTQIQNDEMTIQRVRKSVSERGWDHDWSRTIIALGESDTVKRWLQGKSGQEEVKPTAIENGMVGFLTYLEENAKVADRIDFRKHFCRTMGAITMADGILDDVYPQQAGGAPFTRMRPSIANASAREVTMGHHGDWTVQEHRDKMQKFLSLFDAPLFELLRNQQKSHDNADGLATEIRGYLNEHYPGQSTIWNTMKTVAHVFDKTEQIIKAVTDKYTDAEFLERIKWLRSSDPAIQAVESQYHVTSGGGGGHGGH